MEKKMQAWLFATGMVQPIVEQHGLEKYPTGGNIFSPGTTITPVDQHIDSALRVADWLLED